MKISNRAIMAVTLAATATVAFGRRSSVPTHEVEAPGHESLEESPDLRFRHLIREKICRDTAEGRRSLFEAAELFRQLNEISPVALPDTPLVPPLLRISSDTAEGRLCRQVIVFAYWTLRRDGLGQVAESMAIRLDDDYQQELRKHGAVRLPNPSTLESVSELFGNARLNWRAP